MEDVKTINISGGAADYITGVKKKKRNTKKKQEGCNEPAILKGTESASSASNASNYSISSSASNASSSSNASNASSSSNASNSSLKYPIGIPQIRPVPSHTLHINNTINTSDQHGGKNVKVELKKKINPKKVHLNPKKEAPKLKKHTKKIRKVTLGVSTFHKRITRAKKLHKTVKELPLDKLKEKLIKDGLIKSTSKAPESILRQIASDSEVVSKRAL